MESAVNKHKNVERAEGTTKVFRRTWNRRDENNQPVKVTVEYHHDWVPGYGWKLRGHVEV